MQTLRIDTLGMRCPQPVLMLAHKARGLAPGTLVEVIGDCPTFEKDVRSWAEREKRTVLAVLGSGAKLSIQLRL